MCSLCGMLGDGGHWTDSGSSPEAFGSRGEAHTRARERQARTRLLNAVLKHFALELSDWAGAAYVLRGRTGQSAIINNLAELWPAAERIGRRPCDPLDVGLLGALGGGGDGAPT